MRMKFGKKTALSWAAVILWMLLIFIFSAQPAKESEQISMGIAGIILKFIEDLALIAGANADLMANADYLVRKSAHAFVFFVLTMLVVNALLKTGIKGFGVFIFAFLITLAYACTDEIHQMFVPGRACMLSDVGIDATGAIAGLGLSGIWYWINGHKLLDFRMTPLIVSAKNRMNMFKSMRPDNE
ncbi:MAG: VanZ family protein [Victivallaceae bacterium]